MMTAAAPKPDPARKESWFASGPAIVLYIAAAKLLLHLLTASRYGYFGDELYHMACGEHLDWGYVDEPPLIALVAWFTRHVLGTSLLAIHLLPALAGALLVWLTGVIAGELGGKRFAQALSALSVACAGIYLIMDHLFTMNAFEPLFWMGCAYVVIRIIKTGNQKLWIWFGVLAGLGLENKYSMAVFAFGVVVGLLLTRERNALAHKWIWIAGGIASLIFLPNLIWNIRHHWPFLELLHNIRASGRDIRVGPVEYVARQVLLMNPASFPIWLAGLLYLFFSREGKRFRLLGWAFLSVLATFILLNGKDYYATPVYPVVLAAGAIAIERFAARRKERWLKPGIVAVLLAVTIALLPIVVPVLSAENYLRYQEKLPFKLPASEQSHRAAALPHYYAWSFGWEEMTAAVARVYNSLPPEERAKTAIFGRNFGEAGAIDLLGPKYGLPKAIGGHQSYFLWGPRNYTGETIIVLGDRPEHLRQCCNQVEVTAELYHPYARPGENRPVLVCRGSKGNLQELWPKVKSWD
jgi:hypothetical protein